MKTLTIAFAVAAGPVLAHDIGHVHTHTGDGNWLAATAISFALAVTALVVRRISRARA